MNVKYVGAARDYSGYGEAARNDINALLSVDIAITAKVPTYVMELADFGEVGHNVSRVENVDLPYDTIILHTTPNVYRQYMQDGKYHIARVFWETSRLPEEFAQNIQLCDEIWTGSEYNRKAIQNSGVTKPIYIIPEAINTDILIDLIKPYQTINKDDYRFYSIFEWTERKNPEALLTAFWLEFEQTEGVSLTIKTYLDNFMRSKREEIDAHIMRIKSRLGLKRYAPLYLYRNLMDRQQVYRFHRSFNCFVSAHRGEGWGIPQMEAMLFNHPVISTNCGGIHEYIVNKESGLTIPYTLTSLSGNSRNQHWYTQNQEWAAIDIDELRKAMRYIYEQQAEAETIGKTGGTVVRELFNYQAVGTLMKNRLAEIHKTQV